MREDHFGSRDQKALLERGAQMHLITQYQPYLTYYGRTVGATSPRDVPLKTLMALARLQGNSSFFDLPDDEFISDVEFFHRTSPNQAIDQR